jgi:hypothetical protein
MPGRRAQEVYDAVVHLQRFREKHPGVTVEHKGAPVWHWAATWSQDGESRIVTDGELRHLMERLDRLFPDTEPGRPA